MATHTKCQGHAIAAIARVVEKVFVGWLGLWAEAMPGAARRHCR